MDERWTERPAEWRRLAIEWRRLAKSWGLGKNPGEGGIDILRPDADTYAATDAPVNQVVIKVDPPQNEGDQLL